MSLLTAPADRVRKIRLYRNGDENFTGKEFVLNPRQIRTYDRFLQTVTSHVQLGEAARSVRTPRHGTVVKSLEDLENDRDYVAVGFGRFKNIGYLNLQDRHFQRLQESRRIREEAIKVVEHSNIRVSGRIRKIISDVVTIYVYCNGEEMTPARKVILTFRMMQSWSTILAEVNQHVNPQFSATRVLYTLDGVPIKHKADLKNGAYYVAVGSRAAFRPLDYGKFGKPVFTVSPRINHRRITSDMDAQRRYGDKSSRPFDDDSSAESSSLPPLSTQSEPITEKQRARHQLRQAREAKLVYSDGRDVFHRKPVKLARTDRTNARQAPVDYDKDEGGLFKARSTRRETQDADEVKETRDTRVDLPLDLTAAEQVEEEGENDDAEEESVTAKSNEDTTNRKKKLQAVNNNKNNGEDAAMNGHHDDLRSSPVQNDSVQPQQPAAEVDDDDDEVIPPPDATTPRSHRGSPTKSIRDEPDRNSKTPAASDSQQPVASPRSPGYQRSSSRSPHPDGRTSKDGNVDDRPASKNTRENAAAVKVQSVYRGYRTRKQMKTT